MVRHKILFICIYLIAWNLYSINLPKGIFKELSEEEFKNKETFLTKENIFADIDFVFISNGYDFRSFNTETSERPKGSEPREYNYAYKPCEFDKKYFCDYHFNDALRKDGSYRVLQIIHNNLFKMMFFKKSENKFKGHSYFVRIEDPNIVKQYLEYCRIEYKYSLYDLGYPDPDEKNLYRVTATYLRVRATPNVSGALVMTIPRDGTLYYIETTKVIETIEGLIRPWFKVRLVTGEIGYAFSGFLQKVVVP